MKHPAPTSGNLKPEASLFLTLHAKMPAHRSDYIQALLQEVEQPEVRQALGTG